METKYIDQSNLRLRVAAIRSVNKKVNWKEKGMPKPTQGYLASLAGLSDSGMSRWLKGDINIRYEKFLALEEAVEFYEIMIESEIGE